MGESGEAIDGAEVAGDVDRNEEEVGGEGIKGADWEARIAVWGAT